MTRGVQIPVIAAACLANTLLIVAPCMLAANFASLGDVRCWVLIAMANALVAVEAGLTDSTTPRASSQKSESDYLAVRLALLSSLSLLGIYWCAVTFAASASAPSVAIGTMLLACGIALRAFAMGTLGKSFRSEVTVTTEQKLIRDGIYRYLRHPSETGLLGVGLGAAMLLGSFPALLVCLLVFLPLTLWRIGLEERCLRAGFGDEFARYARTTGGLIPRLPRTG